MTKFYITLYFLRLNNVNQSFFLLSFLIFFEQLFAIFNMIYPKFTKEEKERLEQEVRKNLFKLPNEEEIERDLEEVEALKQLDDEQNRKRAELETRRQQLTYKRLQKIEDEQKRMAKRLEELINEQPEDEQQLKQGYFELKAQADKKKAEEDAILEQIRDRRQEFELERLVRKKLELERIAEKKHELNRQFEKASLVYEVIGEEEKLRRMEGADLVVRALQRKGADVTENEARLLADALVDVQVEAEE